MSAAKKSKISVSTKICWEIPNCSRSFVYRSEPGDSIKSDTFTVSNNNAPTKWYLELFPNGCSETHKSNVSIELHSPSENDPDCIDFKVKFKIGVVKKNNREHVFTTFKTEGSKEELKQGFGFQRLLSHSALFNNSFGYVVNDTLIFVVELNVEFEEENVEHLTEAALSPTLNAKMKNDVKKMFESDDFKNDFQLKTSDGEVLKAHRFILAARSPVFYAMLTTDMKESKDGSVDVPDFDSTIMKEVLRFIYGNEIEGLKQVAPELIFAAEKYQLDELKNICVQEILSALDPQNAVESLKIAHQVSAGKLFEKCLELIMSNNNEVSQAAIWQTLPNELIAKIIRELSKRAKR